MITFKEAFYKSSKITNKAIINNLKNLIQSSIKEKQSNTSYLNQNNSSQFLCKSNISYYNEVQQYKDLSYLNILSDRLNFTQIEKESNMMITEYKKIYGEFDPLVLDAEIYKAFSTFLKSPSFAYSANLILDIIVKAFLVENPYIQIKAVAYLSMFYLNTGQTIIAKELIIYAMKQFEINNIKCTHLLFLILELHSNVDKKPASSSLYKDYKSSIEAQISQININKNLFINDDQLNIKNIVTFSQYAMFQNNESRVIICESELFKNIKLLDLSIKINESILSAVEYVHYDINSNNYILHLNSIKLNLGYGYHYKALLSKLANRDLIINKLNDKATYYIKNYNIEIIKSKLSTLGFYITISNINEARELLSELDNSTFNFSDYPILHMSYLFSKIQLMILIGKVKKENTLGKVIEYYREFVAVHGDYFNQEISEKMYLLNMILKNNDLKSVIMSSSNQQQV